MFNGLLDQVCQLESPRGLKTIHRRGLPAANALQKVLELGIERFDRGGAHLLDETVIAVKQLPMVGGVPLMGTAMDVQGCLLYTSDAADD